MRKESLLAQFRTSSQAQTEILAELSAPIAIRILKEASDEQKLVIGYLGDGYGGKTPHAKAIIRKFFRKSTRESLMKPWSDTYVNDHDPSMVVHHYDIEGIKSSGYYVPELSSIEKRDQKEQEEYAKHKATLKTAICHVVEWPPFSMPLTMLWSLEHSCSHDINYTEDSDRDIKFFAPPLIGDLRETKQFLEDAKEFLIP